MKKILLLILFYSFFSSISCFATKNIVIPPGNSKFVKGSGNVVNKLRKVENFDKLDISGVYNIFLVQGEKESLRIEADDNLHEHILTKVKDGVLIIKTKEDIEFRSPTKNNIYITMKDISRIEVGGVCNFVGKNVIKANSLKLIVSGVSDMDLNVECNSLNIRASGVGDCDFRGKSDIIAIDCMGTRDVDAKKLISKKAIVSKSGVGDVFVNVSEELEIDASGTGDVVYYGDPVLKLISKSGVGDIIKK